MRKAIFFICAALTVIGLRAQDRNFFERRYFVQGTDSLPYRILYPQDYDAGKKYPLVFFLHGSGERGKDNSRQLTWGADLFLDSANRHDYPAIVVFPQCPMTSLWGAIGFKGLNDSLRFFFPAGEMPIPVMRLFLALTKELSANPAVDTTRIYVGGISMGGFATFEVLWRKPHFFAAAFAICGAGNPDQVSLYGNKFPIWIFHGDRDRVVPVSNSRLMYHVLMAQGASARYTEYPGMGHDCYKKALAEPDLLPWLFAQHKNF